MHTISRWFSNQLSRFLRPPLECWNSLPAGQQWVYRQVAQSPLVLLLVAIAGCALYKNALPDQQDPKLNAQVSTAEQNRPCSLPENLMVLGLKDYVCEAIVLEGDNQPSYIECFRKFAHRTEVLRIPVVTTPE